MNDQNPDPGHPREQPDRGQEEPREHRSSPWPDHSGHEDRTPPQPTPQGRWPGAPGPTHEAGAQHPPHSPDGWHTGSWPSQHPLPPQPQGHPGAWGPRPPEPEVVPSVQPQSRGCATVGIVAAVLGLLVLAAGAIGYAVNREVAEAGDFASAPECDIAETEVLEELVPDHELEVEEPIGGPQEAFGSGRQCRWATPGGPGESVPGVATLVAVAAPDPGGIATAADNLRSTTAQHDTRELDGIGEEAVTWTQGEPYTVSCVGTRVSNLYLEACYTVAAGYDARTSGDEERISAGAEQFVLSVLEALSE